MQVIEYSVQGTSPLLLHNPAGMQQPSDAIKRKSIPTSEEEAEAGTYRLADGQLALPAFAFRAALVGAAKGRRMGKVAAATIVKGAVFVTDEMVPLFTTDDRTPAKDYEIDTRRVVVQNNGIVRSRPKLFPWRATFPLELDEGFITGEHVAELLDIAGRLVGVGDFRPERSGPFGRFGVLGWS